MEGLKYKAYAFGPELRSAIFIEIRKIRLVEDDVPVGWQVQSCQQRQQRRLARSGRSDDSNRFTRRNCETDIRKNSQSPFRTANLFA